MSKDLVPVVTGKDLISFEPEKLALIRKTVAKDLDAAEFDLFIAVAKARGLDPVLNQIHAVKRNDKDAGTKRMVIQVGIDGLRLIAARTGEYAGSSRSVYERNEKGDIIAAEVTVHRFVKGKKCAFTGVAYWDEFYPGEKMGFMWDKMPHSQLSKCAEAQALRKGFPNDLSGLYVAEEIMEKDVTPSNIPETNDAFEDDSRAKAIAELVGKFRKLGVSEKMIRDRFKLGSTAALDLNDDEIKELNQIGNAIVKDKKPVKEFFPLPNFATGAKS